MLAFSSLPKFPTSPIKALIIFLHGLGDVGRSWLPFFSNFSASNPDILLVFPNAPVRAVTLNYGMQMPAWYDIKSLSDAESKEDEQGFERSARDAKLLIDELVLKYSIDPSMVIIGGFSQGGAVSLYAKLKKIIDPKALIILSGYLPFSKTKFSSLPILDGCQIFWGHGDSDPLIPMYWARQSTRLLLGAGAKVQFHAYQNLDHSVNSDEMDEMENFINLILKIKK